MLEALTSLGTRAVQEAERGAETGGPGGEGRKDSSGGIESESLGAEGKD